MQGNSCFYWHAENLDIKLLPTFMEIFCDIAIKNNERNGIFLIGDKKSLSLEQVLEVAKMEGVIG